MEKKSDEKKKEEGKSPTNGKRNPKKKFYIRGMLKQEGILIDEDVLDRDKDPTEAAQFFDGEEEIRKMQSKIKDLMRPTKS